MGSVGAEYTVSGTSWSVLTLEAGKSPTELRHGELSCPWHIAVFDFRVHASPPSCTSTKGMAGGAR